MLLGMFSVSRSANAFMVWTKVSDMRLGSMQCRKQYAHGEPDNAMNGRNFV